jgi:hypothetical protein
MVSKIMNPSTLIRQLLVLKSKYTLWAGIEESLGQFETKYDGVSLSKARFHGVNIHWHLHTL